MSGIRGVSQLADCFPGMYETSGQRKPGTAACTCNYSLWEVGKADQAHGPPWPQSEFKVSLVYIENPSQKEKKKKKKRGEEKRGEEREGKGEEGRRGMGREKRRGGEEGKEGEKEEEKPHKIINTVEKKVYKIQLLWGLSVKAKRPIENI